MLTEDSTHRNMQHSPLFALSALLLAALLFGGCASAANLQSMAAPASQAPAPAGLEDVVAPLSDYVVVTSPLTTPTPTPEAGEEKQYVTVIAQPRTFGIRFSQEF